MIYARNDERITFNQFFIDLVSEKKFHMQIRTIYTKGKQIFKPLF